MSLKDWMCMSFVLIVACFIPNGYVDCEEINEIGEKINAINASQASTVLDSPGGINSKERFGYSICIGDFNSDFYPDLAIGAPYYGTNNGRVYLYFGSSDGFKKSPSLTIDAPSSGKYFGSSLSSGKINSDKYYDLVVGTKGGRDVYVYFGGKNMDSNPDMIYTGPSSFGISVDTGNFDSIGGDDILVGAPSNISAHLIKNPSGNITFKPGYGTWYDFGFSVDSADCTNDGEEDAVIGSPYRGWSSGGRVWMYLFRNPSMTGFNDDWPDYILKCPSSDDGDNYFGYSVDVGKYTLSTYSSILIGAPKINKAYLFKNGGKFTVAVSHGSNPRLNSTPDYIFKGLNDSFFGCCVKLANIDGKNHSDVVIGGHSYKNNTGIVSIFYSPFSSTETIADVNITGENKGDLFGYSIASADFNGDGTDDLVVGSPGYKSNALYGRVYVFDPKIDFTPNVRPVAILNAEPINATVNETINFSAEKSYDIDGKIMKYNFSFGDGNSTGWINTSNISHSYSAPGDYNASLKVMDNKGAMSNNKNCTVIVHVNAPPIAFLTANKTKVFVNETIQLSAVNSTDNTKVKWYNFSFGDGNSTGWIEHCRVNYTYKSKGNYTASVVVKDDENLESENEAFVNITVIEFEDNKAPVAVLKANRTEVYVNEVILFTGNESWDDIGIKYYNFSFGDGNFTNWIHENFSLHSYSSPGNYTVILTVMDYSNLMSNDSLSIHVMPKPSEENEPPIAILKANRTKVYEGEEISFDASSSYDIDGSVTEYFIDFGDGNNSGWTDYSNIFHSYDMEGEYTATLKVKDSLGKMSENDAFVVIEVNKKNRAPIGIIKANKTEILVGEKVTLDASFSYDPDGDKILYKYDFGDGEFTEWTMRNKYVHKYSEKGNYNVILTVKDAHGAVSQNKSLIIKVIEKTAPPPLPKPLLKGKPLEIETGERVSFEAVYLEDYDVAFYFYEFGDGSISDWTKSSRYSHEYTLEGVYHARVKVKLKDGRMSPWSDTVGIRVVEPVDEDVKISIKWEPSWLYILLIILLILTVSATSAAVYYHRKATNALEEVKRLRVEVPEPEPSGKEVKSELEPIPPPPKEIIEPIEEPVGMIGDDASELRTSEPSPPKQETKKESPEHEYEHDLHEMYRDDEM